MDAHRDVGVDRPRVPSRQEHDRLIRKVWTLCGIGAALVVVGTGGTVWWMFHVGYDPKRIVEISTAIFQVLVLGYGLGFFVPMLITSVLKMGLGVEMSRQGIEIGEKTVDAVEEVQREIKPILRDAREVIGAVRGLVDDLKAQNPTRIVEFAEKLSRDGTLERIVTSIEQVGVVVNDAVKRIEAKAVGSIVEKL